ncbi:hypothetical protein MKW94_017842, partial [Papaver nudicaule]|nr:hypothetical protein [Papaver nudicaule]
MLVGHSTGPPRPPPPPPPPMGGGGGNTDLIPASMNSSKLTSVLKQLSSLVTTGQRFDSRQFNLCVALARGIDYAIANDEIPDGVQELPSLFKQVCKDKNGVLLQATGMMLMVSLKSACRSGWFLAKDADELLDCANKLRVGFCNPADIVIEPTNPPPIISKILNRFCPCIKMTRIFASLELKPGFGAYLLDFHVSKNDATAREKIRLFVARMDNVDTSACLITPQEANFLLNGKGIRRRTINSLDHGPQIPTNVTAMVKYGTNLLQAVGHFNGNYTIIIGFTSEVSSIDIPDLQHYARPLSAVNSLDSEIVKGVSRISLNCPISFKRISVPVKGRLCKHHQCFDYANYIKINSRKPSWCCPQCNQSVCYTDIRIDQRMVEVLEDVGENVADVIVSADGSWKPVRETDDPSNKKDKTPRLGIEGDDSDKCVPERFSDSAANVVKGINGNDAMHTSEVEDLNPLKNYVDVNPPMEFDTTGIQNEDAFCSGFLFSNSSAASDTVAQTPNTRLNPRAMDPILEPSLTSFRLIRVVTDAVTPTHNLGPGDVPEASQPTTSLTRNYPETDNISLQWLLKINGESWRQKPRNITRTPKVVQALPVQPLVPNSRQRARPRPRLSFSTSSTADAGGAIETPQQRFSRSNMDANSADMSASPGGFPSMTQNWVPRQPSSCQSNDRISSSQTSEDLQNHQPSPVARVSHLASQPVMARPAPHLSHMLGRQGGSLSNAALQPRGQHFLMKSQQPAQRERTLPVVPVQLQPIRDSSSLIVGDTGKALIGEQRRGNGEAKIPKFSRVNNSSEATPVRNWQPPGRMRGSLSGRTFSDALTENIILPSQVTSPSTTRASPVNPISTPGASGGSSQRLSAMPPPVNTISTPSGCGSSQRSLGMPPPVYPISTPSGSGVAAHHLSAMPPPVNTISTPSASGGLSQRPLRMPPPVNPILTPSNSDGSAQRLSAMPPPVNTISTPSASGGSSQRPLGLPPPVNPILTPSDSDGSDQRLSAMPPPVNTISTPSGSGGSSQHPLGMPPPVNPTPGGSGGLAQIPSYIADNSDKHATTLANQRMQVDAEVCDEAEVGTSETEQQSKYGVRGLKMQKHPTLVQAEMEVYDEAGFCRILRDDDEAEGKKMKKTVAREELGLNRQSGLTTEGLNKTNVSVKQGNLTANCDGSIMSMEVESNPGEKTSVIFKPKKSNAKNDVKEKHQSVKIVQERFVCRACGQEGHMRTNKNCPMYGEYLDTQIKLTNNMHAPTMVDQPMQVDAEECEKAEVGSNESKTGKTDGARELEMLKWAAGLCRMRLDGKQGKHPTQVQADEEIEDEAAGLCRMENISRESRDPKEVESVCGETTFSGNIESVSDAKVKHSASKNTRERFVCGACGQDGHMRTSKNCPRYGKDVDIQMVESSGGERVSGKRNRSSSNAQPKIN